MRTLRALAVAACSLWFTLPALADARIAILADVLRLDEVTQLLRDEGLDYAQSLNTDLLSGRGGPFWAAQAERIYDPIRMSETVLRALEAGLDGPDLDATIAFFASPLGEQIIALENAARRAINDPGVEETARAAYLKIRGSDEPLLALLQRFVDANDLVERNVAAAMSANYQFDKGLSDGRWMDVTEAEILEEIWAQEAEVRADTELWLFAYLLMAYSPLSLDDLARYVDFSASAAGQALNTALFDGYGQLYRDISYALGRAVALSGPGNEL